MNALLAVEPLAVDVAICGAGPVGMALAILLVKRGVAPGRIALIDAKPLAAVTADPRSIALSHGSEQTLQAVGAWPLPATAIHQIHVSRRGQFGRTLMDRAEHDLPALGYVTRYGDLVAALAAAGESAGLQPLRPARAERFDEDADGVTLTLDDGRVLRAQVAVQAEGGVFGTQAPRAVQRDYEQSAVIARVSASNPIAHRAFERFTDEGPLALLPQEGPDGLQYALVWCARPDHAARLLELDDSAFLACLGRMFGSRLGTFYGRLEAGRLSPRPERRRPVDGAHGRHRQRRPDPAPRRRPGPEPGPARRRRAGPPAGGGYHRPNSWPPSMRPARATASSPSA